MNLPIEEEMSKGPFSPSPLVGSQTHAIVMGASCQFSGKFQLWLFIRTTCGAFEKYTCLDPNLKEDHFEVGPRNLYGKF